MLWLLVLWKTPQVSKCCVRWFADLNAQKKTGGFPNYPAWSTFIHGYGKIHHFLMGKLTISMAIFNSHGILIVISGYPYIYGLQELMDICRLHPPKTALRPFSIATLNYQNVYSMEPSSDRHLVIEVGTTMLPAWEVLQQDMKGEAGSLVCSVVPQVRKKLSWWT